MGSTASEDESSKYRRLAQIIPNEAQESFRAFHLIQTTLQPTMHMPVMKRIKTRRYVYVRGRDVV
ncbi:hypothetical protein KIN20_016114 [Parelaphostrongylus tenuis]|uniref:Uncharacterized protein n=1 Tax=Parelaphostrongylus tenuis TaxID=148309 RepID=A0AAD5MFY4_PARTN|nr:hypothetical protein KIN20_016114 [Parelaphostrongylus tenuis]